MGAFRPLVRLRFWLALAVLLGAVPAFAGTWVETSVVGHSTRLSIEVQADRANDGAVVVRHQLTVKVRGGPIQHLDVPGVPTGIELLPDAALRRAEAGQPLLYPLEVQSTEEGTLRLLIQSERGIRGGTYVFDFGFRGSLRELLRPESVEGMTGLTYVAPRLSSGVDAAKVEIELPRTAIAPRLWTTREGPSVSLLEQPGRNVPERVEIVLVRPHVAVLEPATWKFLVDPTLVPLEAARSAPLGTRVSATTLEHALVRRGFDAQDVLVSLSLAAFFALLVFVKARAFGDACRRAGVDARSLLPLPPWARSSLAAVGAGVGAYAALSHRAGLTVGCALGIIVAATELWPARRLVARGPGRWRRLEDLAPAPSPRSAAAPILEFFEVRRMRGLLLFSGSLAVTGFLALRILASSPYWSLLVWVAWGLTLPLFFTGRLAELPKTPSELALSWRKLLLRRSPGTEFDVWLRVPLGDAAQEGPPDEARLRVRFSEPPRGLRTLEVGFEEGLGAWVKPCLVVRVVAGSEAETRLGALAWSRGREMEEKVAILRPSSARPQETLRLLQSVIARLRVSGSTPSERKTSRKSSGTSATARQMKLDRPVPVL